MALVVRNTDIINNTGITLANPTGATGTYALRNQPNITSYSWDTATINGELFTGKIVTVGSGKDYSNFAAAVSAASAAQIAICFTVPLHSILYPLHILVSQNDVPYF